MRSFILSGLLFLTGFVQGQNAADQIKETVEFLSDDRLEGRATGSRGEEIAANYIAGKFSALGLQPAGENSGFFQVFSFSTGKEAGEQNFVVANSKRADAQPVFFSGSGQVQAQVAYAGYGITAPELQHDDYQGLEAKGKILLIQLSTPEGTHPHTDFYPYADERSKVELAMEHGAVAVLFYNMDQDYDPSLLLDYSSRAEAAGIPVLFIEPETANTLTQGLEILVGADIHPVRKEGKNIAARIDNGAPCTIILGAHYDHLGYGESGGSLYRGQPAIHNGADDNASGVALILQLAENLAKDPDDHYNYLFIAFSGEELGLYGSKSIADFLTAQDDCYNYMLNFDMVGRLDSIKTLIVNGYGTSPAWTRIDDLGKMQGFTIKTYSSGIGPSDHTSFYLKDIPVLHFFTGTHEDYHKPSDDADKINYEGIVELHDLVRALMADLDDEDQVEFTRTKEEESEETPRFTVGLGVIPDYTFEGKGMRIDGVSDGKTAANAGLQTGDIVIRLGDYNVADMMSYMKALSMFEKGDATTATVIRAEEEMTFPIQF